MPTETRLIQDRPFPENSPSYPSEALCVALQTRWLGKRGVGFFGPWDFFQRRTDCRSLCFYCSGAAWVKSRLPFRSKTPGSKAQMFQTAWRSKFSNKFFALLRGMLLRMKKNIRRVIKKKLLAVNIFFISSLHS